MGSIMSLMGNDRIHPTVDKFIAELAGNEKNIRFARLLKICEDAFGECRISGGHHIFKTPWPGDPRINLQNAGNKAKPYQVKQVIGALKKLRSINNSIEE